MKIKLLALFSVLVVGFISIYFFDHQLAPSTFESIELNQSYAEVVEVLGEPDYQRTEGQLLVIGYQKIHPIWCVMEITFDGDLVCSKFHDH